MRDFVPFLLLALITSFPGFSTNFRGVQYHCAAGASSLTEGVHNFAESVECFWVMPDHTVSPEKSYPAYSWSLEVNKLAERCVDWYPCNTETGKARSIPSRSILSQQWASARSLYYRRDRRSSRKVRENSVEDAVQRAQCCWSWYCSTWWGCSFTS